MSKVAFVFAGQGAQAPGMGKSLYETCPAARKVFDTAESIRPGTVTQCFEGTPEELAITQNTQPCLYCVDLAAAEALRAEGIIPAAAAGFSLGELAALTFSGAASPEVGFSIVCRRAHRMQQELVEQHVLPLFRRVPGQLQFPRPAGCGRRPGPAGTL